jgi:O-antigen/teichoic acid export membrane protein
LTDVRLPGVQTLRRSLGDPARQVRAQTGLYVVSAAGAGVLGIASQALIARELGVDEFAVYAFCFGLLQFSAILFEFGLFIPAARRSALAEGEERQAIVGAALLTYLPVGLLFSLTIFAISFGINSLVEFDAESALRLAAALALVFPFITVGQTLAQGTGRMHVFSLSSLGWQILFAAALAALVLADVAFDSGQALLLRELAMGFGALAVCLWLRPRFTQLGERVRALVADARSYGFSIYVGRVLSMGTYNMDVLLVGLFADAEAVAFYSLAKLLAYAVSLPASGAAGSLFSRMATMDALEPRWLAFAYASGLSLALPLALLAGSLIGLIYGDEFTGAASLILPLALAEMLRGVTAFYNLFLASHAEGHAVRTAGVAFTVANLVVSFTLIPLFAASGAAWASLIAITVNLLVHIRGYRRARRSPSPAVS